MPPDYYGRLPKLLREELADGRWLPVVGAGMSANAITPEGKSPPMWDALGAEINAYMPTGHGADGPVDAISTYEQLHGRPALIDRVSSALLINDVVPGRVHKAFARIPFDTVVTTNVDFLLEQAWADIGWPLDPIVGEQRLTARRRGQGTQLVKFHGDIHHPNELVLSERDYDSFLTKFPLLATYVAGLLITRVPVLLGYSLNDPDFRSILTSLNARLGGNRPAPWVILAKSSVGEVARFERRGVRVVVLDQRTNVPHENVFAQFFSQLAQELPEVAAEQAEASEDQILAQLRLTGQAAGGLVLFLGTPSFLAYQREFVFPTLYKGGLSPVTTDDVRSAPGLSLASQAQLVRRAAVIVVDARASSGVRTNLSFVRSNNATAPIMLVTDAINSDLIHQQELLADHPGRVLVLSGNLDDAAASVVARQIIETAQVARPFNRTSGQIAERLSTGDVSFALIEAVIAIESLLRRETLDERSPISRVAAGHPLINEDDEKLIKRAYRLRSEFLHRGVVPQANEARSIIRALIALIDRLEDGNAR